MSEFNSTLEEKDLVRLDELAEEFDEETAKELAVACLEDGDNAIIKINSALSQGNLEDIRVGAHMLKGCSRVIKADPLEKCSSDLELAAKTANNSEITELVKDLNLVYQRTKQCIEKYVSE